MLTVITKRRTTRKFLVYDLEWIPGTLELRLVGVYDNERGYRCYRTIEDFLSYEMTSKNRGKWFYAHAGGLADFQFVLEKLIDKKGNYKVRASFSGSSAIIVHVTQGKNSWHFVDSYWLLRDTLRNIGRHIGIAKGNVEQSVEWYATASFEELREYNEIDCIILWKAIDEFESVLLGLGSQLKMTIASCAMELFRRRFLKQDVDTSATVNETSRNAYFASRVEVISTECHDALYYDVNSSFPYAMTMPQPGELMRTSRHLPDHGIYLADVTVTIPDNYLPTLPIRREGRLFFPTGTWRGWYSSIDIELLQECGGRVVRCHESMSFHPIDDLRDYALTVYQLRKKAVGFEKLVLKYLLNSLYGKFGESPYKTHMAVNPDTPQPEWIMYAPGVFIAETQVPIPHMHVPISVHITAIARRTLYDYMTCSAQLHYCDTDGFSTAQEYKSSSELGSIKLEKRIRHGRFIQAKLYDLDGTDEHGDLRTEYRDAAGFILADGNRGLKGKGFSKLTLDKMERLMRGEDIEYVRMARIRELARSGDFRPREDVIRKRLQLTNIPKRFFYPDGHSRPWDIDEIGEAFKP